MNYREYKDARQEAFNEVPMFFAFSNEQFNKAMQERGYTDESKIVRVPNGGFIHKDELPKLKAWIDGDNLDELMKDPDFAEDAFYYEMGNHEYHINNYQGNWDVISCFANVEYCDNDYDVNEYFKQVDWSDETKNAYMKARSRFLQDASDNDWY